MMRNSIWIATSALTFFVLELFAQTGPLDKQQIRYEYFAKPSGYFAMWTALNSNMQAEGDRILYDYTTKDSAIVARLHYHQNFLVDSAIINAPDLQLKAFFVTPVGDQYKIIDIPDLKEMAVPHGLYTRTIFNQGKEISYEKYNYRYGRKNGACEEYALAWSNGKPTWKYYTMTDDVLQGNYFIKNNSGDTLEFGQYAGGRKEGWWKSTNTYSGERSLTFYQNDRRNGESKTWNANNLLVSEAFYVNDRKEGSHRTWHANGQLASEAFYKRGVIQQTFRSWYQNGNLQRFSQFDTLGDLHGLNEWYHENGRIAYRQHFVHSKMEGISDTWNADGVLTERIHYHIGMREGKSEYFFPNGKLQKEEYYHVDKLNGTVKVWDEKGKLIMHKLYKEDEEVKNYLDLHVQEEELYDVDWPNVGVGSADAYEDERIAAFSNHVFRLRYQSATLNCVRDYSMALTDSLNAYYLQLSKKQKKKWNNIEELQLVIELRSNVQITTLIGADEEVNQELLAYLRRVMKCKCYSYHQVTMKIIIPSVPATEKQK